MNPLVSLIVNCYNQGHYLERSVKSVLAQTFTDIECLIIDDGSYDNTRQLAEYLMSIDSRVKYYFKENGGLPAARSFGIKQAQGEWIQCLDADDWIHEDKIRFQLSYVPQDKKENIVFYCDYERVVIGNSENPVDRQENIIGSLTTEQFIQRLLIPDFLAGSPHPALQQCMLMHKSIFSNHCWDEKLKALGDRYFAVDILMNGVKFIYTPMVGAFYTKHQANRTNNWSYMKNYYLMFYEMINQQYQELGQLCTIGTNYLLEEVIREKEQEHFDRLVKIAQPPFEICEKKIKLHHVALVKLFYIIRLRLPNCLLYKQYRGPRSQKVLSMFSQFLHLAQTNS